MTDRMTPTSSRQLPEEDGGASFTPGPWEARRSLIHVEGRGTLATVSNPWNDEQEREANARLIAAAPTLYRELEAAGAIFRAYEALHLEKGTEDGNEKARRNAAFAETIERTLALARAEGGDAQRRGII